MKLCSKNHEEVCYESRDCPACELADAHETTISKMLDYESGLENRIGELEGEIEEVKANSAE